MIARYLFCSISESSLKAKSSDQSLYSASYDMHSKCFIIWNNVNMINNAHTMNLFIASCVTTVANEAAAPSSNATASEIARISYGLLSWKKATVCIIEMIDTNKYSSVNVVIMNMLVSLLFCIIFWIFYYVALYI